jgi:hypothetical protein
VGVDAEPHPGPARAHLGEYGLDVARQTAAGGVAQHDEVGAALDGGRNGLKRVVAVVPEAVFDGGGFDVVDYGILEAA